MRERVSASTAACCSGVSAARRLAARASSAWRRDSACCCSVTMAGTASRDCRCSRYFSTSAADNVLCGSGLAAAVGEVRGGDLLQVVDVVDEAAFDLVHLRVDVAGDGDVDEEHGAVAAAREELLAVGAGEDVAVGAGRGDDDVGAAGLRVELLERDDFGGAGDGVRGLLAICTEICSAMWPAMSAAFSWVRLATRMEVAPCWMR